MLSICGPGRFGKWRNYDFNWLAIIANEIRWICSKTRCKSCGKSVTSSEDQSHHLQKADHPLPSEEGHREDYIRNVTHICTEKTLKEKSHCKYKWNFIKKHIDFFSKLLEEFNALTDLFPIHQCIVKYAVCTWIKLRVNCCLCFLNF